MRVREHTPLHTPSLPLFLPPSLSLARSLALSLSLTHSQAMESAIDDSASAASILGFPPESTQEDIIRTLLLELKASMEQFAEVCTHSHLYTEEGER